MNKLKFNSQLCTTKIQSQRLLDLGLKPETADCYHWEYAEQKYIGNIDDDGLIETDVPAWSLHRLMEIAIKGNKIPLRLVVIQEDNIDDCYECLICDIEEMIDFGCFNKEYLKQ